MPSTSISLPLRRLPVVPTAGNNLHPGASGPCPGVCLQRGQPRGSRKGARAAPPLRPGRHLRVRGVARGQRRPRRRAEGHNPQLDGGLVVRRL